MISKLKATYNYLSLYMCYNFMGLRFQCHGFIFSLFLFSYSLSDYNFYIVKSCDFEMLNTLNSSIIVTVLYYPRNELRDNLYFHRCL